MKAHKFLFLLSFGIILLFAACESNILEEKATENKTGILLKTLYSPANWMGVLDDSNNLSEISIPGSHDAGALYETFSGTAKCQEFTIDNQLNSGVRFLDIRCRHIDDAFAIHHGSVYQHMNFDDVLNYCFNFLNSNPTECIIISVKEEYDASNITRTFEETFDSYVAKSPGSWYLGATIPELGLVRGKIVLFRRFSSTSTPKGIDATSWKDDATFEVNNGNARLKIQDDYYVTDTDEKWNAITSLLGEAETGNSSTLYVNFTSGYKPLIFGIPSITSVSSVINPLVSSYFISNISGRYGILPMDFVNEELNALIIETNF